MPELPEVETTKLGLEPLIVNQTVERAYLHRANLRWEMPKHLVTTLSNQSVNKIQRRGKYLLIKFEVGTLIIHLGMSGSIKVVDNDTPLEKHDHFELVFTNGKKLRLNDPRRFGAVLFSENGSHPLLDSLRSVFCLRYWLCAQGESLLDANSRKHKYYPHPPPLYYP
jgi:formamidopyrimidine-DNA glycosylase